MIYKIWGEQRSESFLPSLTPLGGLLQYRPFVFQSRGALLPAELGGTDESSVTCAPSCFDLCMSHTPSHCGRRCVGTEAERAEPAQCPQATPQRGLSCPSLPANRVASGCFSGFSSWQREYNRLFSGHFELQSPHLYEKVNCFTPANPQSGFSEREKQRPGEPPFYSHIFRCTKCTESLYLRPNAHSHQRGSCCWHPVASGGLENCRFRNP